LNIPSSHQAQVIAVPFTHTGEPAAQQWSADVWISWHGKRLHYQHRSVPLFPAIPSWQAAITNGEVVIPEARILRKGKLAERLTWVPYRQSEERVDNASALYWLSLFQQYHAAGQPAGGKAYLAARVGSELEQVVNLVFACNAIADFWINGQRYDAIGESSDDQPYPFAKGMGQIVYRVHDIRLKAGENDLLVKLTPPEPGWVQWHAAGVLQDLHGNAPSGITYLEFEDIQNN
jgi:hypothetical protein